MARVLYVFAPTENVIKGPNTPKIPIFIHVNNVTFSDIILTQHQDSSIEDFVQFIKRCPLRCTFCDVLEPFYPKQVCEFIYSCTVNTIAQTIGDGHCRVFISTTSICQALHLPQLDHDSEAPFEAKCRYIRPTLGYDFSLQGKREPNKFTIHQSFHFGWKYLTGVIGKFLGHKSGSLNQLNLFE